MRANDAGVTPIDHPAQAQRIWKSLDSESEAFPLFGNREFNSYLETSAYLVKMRHRITEADSWTSTASQCWC